MSENNKIQGLWVGPELSVMEILSIQSFLKNGHDYFLYTYDDIKNVPKGTTLCDANEILPANRVFTYQTGWGKGSYAGFSNYFRYQLLFKKGGWWVDTDVICLKKWELSDEIIIASSYEGKWGFVANSNVLKFPAGSPYPGKMFEICNNTDTSQVKFGQTGPRLVQHIVREFNLEKYLAPYHYFNPVSYPHVKQSILGIYNSPIERIKEVIRPLLKPGSSVGRKTLEDSYAVHLWNEVWRQNGLDKNGVFPLSSLYEQLKRRYL